VPFGEGPPESYDLYLCYENYFHALLENAQIMRSSESTNQQLQEFLQRLEKYIRNEVMSGRSDYASFNRFV